MIPNNFYMVLPFAVGIILNEESKILLGKHPLLNRKPYPGFWDLPGGKTEPNETIKDGLRRELLEETGFNVIGYQGCGEFHHSKDLGTITKECTSDIPSLCICYKLQVEGEFKPQEMENMNWFSKEDALKLQLTPWTRFFLEKL